MSFLTNIVELSEESPQVADLDAVRRFWPLAAQRAPMAFAKAAYRSEPLDAFAEPCPRHFTVDDLGLAERAWEALRRLSATGSLFAGSRSAGDEEGGDISHIFRSIRGDSAEFYLELKHAGRITNNGVELPVDPWFIELDHKLMVLEIYPGDQVETLYRSLFPSLVPDHFQIMSENQRAYMLVPMLPAESPTIEAVVVLPVGEDACLHDWFELPPEMLDRIKAHAG